MFTEGNLVATPDQPQQVIPANTPEILPSPTDIAPVEPKPTDVPVQTETSIPADLEQTNGAGLYEPGASRQNPLPLIPGQTTYEGSEWRISIDNVHRGSEATKYIKAHKTDRGSNCLDGTFVVVEYTLTNISSVEADKRADSAFFSHITGDKLSVHSPSVYNCTIDTKFDEGLFPGGTESGSIIYEVDEDERSLVLALDERTSELNSLELEPFFYAIDTDQFLQVPTYAPVTNDAGRDFKYPAKEGERIDVGDVSITFLRSIRGEDAAQRIAEANDSNKPAPEGTEYVLVEILMEYHGYKYGDRNSNNLGLPILKIRDGNKILPEPDIKDTRVPPNPLYLQEEVYPGGTIQGWEILNIPSGRTDLLIRYTQLFDSNESNSRYIAIP